MSDSSVSRKPGERRNPRIGAPQPARPVAGPMPPPPPSMPTLPPRKPGEPRQAVALTYDPENADAPVVTAAGQGLVAEEIIRRAREAGVPVTEDVRLAAVLSQIDVGAMIPPELYTVVAEVLAYVYRLDDRVSRRK
ncbi:MAG: EscU/YscU/HrcU family type III secretion system export apparatus switch protein [Chloroflexota bacterium]